MQTTKKLALVLALVVLVIPMISASEGSGASTADGSSKYLGAALAVGLAGLGAGFAISKVGVASAGAIVEKPELFGSTILYVAFAEAIAIYGLLVALMMIL